MALPMQAPPPQGPPQGPKAPDGNSPDQMIGYIDPNASPKVKTYLLTAKQFLLNAQGAQFVKSLLKTAKGDPSTAIAMFIGKLLEKLQDKLGPLEQQEHDQVAMHLAGWIVSSLQKMGMPGLDDAGARQDLIGRILQALDGMTGANQPQGQHSPQQGPPQQGPPTGAPQPPQAGPPMQQFAPGGAREHQLG
jgi:hypothetical protein